MIEGERIPTITADRVSLRWLDERDVDALFTIFSDPEVMRYWSSPPLENREAAERLLEEIRDGFRQRTLFKWGIALKESDAVIGTCTLFHPDMRNRRAEIGYALAHSYWRKGYVQESLRALINFAFDELNLHRIEADVDPQNAASIRTLERLGFKREGYMRERWLVNGGIYDSLFYGLLRREWGAGGTL